MLEIVPGARQHESIDREKIVNFWDFNTTEGKTGIEVHCIGHKTVLWFNSAVDRDAASAWLRQPVKGKPMKTVIADLQTYLRENRDMVYSVGLLLLIDHFVFDGAFRERLRKLVEGFLVKTEAKAGIINATATRVE